MVQRLDASGASSRPPRFVTLILLSALSVISVNMFVASLSNMAADFQVSYALMNLAIAGYAALTAILQLVMGPLSDRYGRRPIVLSVLSIFLVASIGCFLATDFYTFMACRLLQGVIVAGISLSHTMIRDTHAPQDAASRIGYLASAWALAPMLGPMLGGSIDTLFGWRANFGLFAILAAALLLLCWRDLQETHQQRSATFKAQFKAYPELFRSRKFWAYGLCMAFSVGAFYAFLAGVPLVGQVVFQISAAEIGIYLGTITAGFLSGSFLSGRLAKSIPPLTLILTGRIFAIAGLCAGLLLFATGFVHLISLFGACVFVGFGNGLTMPSCSAGVMSIEPKLMGSASGLAGAMTIGGGALMSALTGLAVTEQTGAYGLLGMMLLSSLIAFAAAMVIRRQEHATPVK